MLACCKVAKIICSTVITCWTTDIRESRRNKKKVFSFVQLQIVYLLLLILTVPFLNWWIQDILLNVWSIESSSICTSISKYLLSCCSLWRAAKSSCSSYRILLAQRFFFSRKDFTRAKLFIHWIFVYSILCIFVFSKSFEQKMCKIVITSLL